jgi:SulP family sulfate permease
MTRRREALADDGHEGRLPIAVALRQTVRDGYDVAALRADVLAGLVVGIVAIPLSMALAIAVDVPPQHGLYTAAVAGAVTALTGGSRFQITGPTAAFVVVLAPIVARHGLAGLLTAGFLAGLILVAMGMARLGRLVEFIPHPVTTGFTAGIATVIAVLQLKDALGLQPGALPAEFTGKVAVMWAARGTWQPGELGIALATLALLLLVPKVTRRIPAPLVALTLVTAAVALLERLVPGLAVATIGSRFHATVDGHVVAGIPPVLPAVAAPWGPDGLSLEALRALVPAAFTIAMLGAIESLLSAVIADGMTGTRHDPDAELVGLGIGNLVAPLFGGIAATGALARTATSIRSGARSPVAALVHAGLVLAAILVLAPLVAHVPMAALAGLLLLVAWNMSEVRHFTHVLRVAPRSDVLVLLVCYALTVLVDMVAAVSVGVVLAALLFMRRMAELTRAHIVEAAPGSTRGPVPPGVAVYEIAGALFFGAAQSAIRAMGTIGDDKRVVVLGLGQVPVIDATGLVALESALALLERQRRFVIIAGPLPEPRSVFEKAELEANMAHVLFAESTEQALAIARDLVALSPQWTGPPSAAVAPGRR